MSHGEVTSTQLSPYSFLPLEYNSEPPQIMTKPLRIITGEKKPADQIPPQCSPYRW